MKPRVCLGVDLVEWGKADLFYKTHRDRLAEIFHPDEAAAIRKSSDPGRTCAAYLAAKEAVFKAFAFTWMGPQGFRDIRIVRAENKKLSFRLEGRFRRFSEIASKPQLSLLERNHYVIAQVRPGSP